jgi:hypothetical protein
MLQNCFTTVIYEWVELTRVANIGLAWKSLPGTNTLAYLALSYHKLRLFIIILSPDVNVTTLNFYTYCAAK